MNFDWKAYLIVLGYVLLFLLLQYVGDRFFLHPEEYNGEAFLSECDFHCSYWYDEIAVQYNSTDGLCKTCYDVVVMNKTIKEAKQ